VVTSYSLYFHVPFCTRKCDYCHFYVIPDQERFKEIYLQALRLEWEMRSPLLPQREPISIYFGGGTPALLGPAAIETILSWIPDITACEITLEANPENVTYALMRDFYSCGVNRISLGIQTLNPALLKTLTRNHGADQASKSVEETFRAGFRNISIDLMYDLPGQTLEQWSHTLGLALRLPITHLSLYNLTVEAHTVFYKKRSELRQPPADISLAMLNQAVERLEQRGFKRYEISAFARQKCDESRHNSGYWTARSFLGFGPSAYSYWGGARFRNVANLNRYAKALAIGHDPLDFTETLLPDEQRKEALAIGLRLLKGVELDTWPASLQHTLDKLIREGFLEKTPTSLRLTPRGLLFHDTVATEIISC
jgi:oxygen-independent coproporphyrinogen III oxidase